MEDSEMLAVQCKLCPVCDGTGERDIAHALPKKRKEFACENCQGQKYVPLVTCRGCGRPAIEWQAAVPYCGRPKCWEALVEMIDPDKKPVERRGYCSGPWFDSTQRFRGTQKWDPFKKEFVDSIDMRGALSPQQEASVARAMSFLSCERDC
jgi:hypothetical protein